MTEQNTEIFTNVDHVIGYEIVKDMTRADMPIVRNYFLKHADEIGSIGDFVDHLVTADAFPPETAGNSGPGAPDSKPESNLAIKVEDGNNLYLIRLANASDNGNYDARAKWGHGSPPIGFIPESVYGANKPLKHVGLFYLDQGRVRFIPEAAIPARLDDVPDVAWLAFRCDYRDMQRLWTDLGYDPQRPFLIPFRYNLFDRETKTPIWSVDHDHLHDDDHDHANSKSQMGSYGTLTHGGKHPDFVGGSAMSIMKGRVHGGIHPNTLIEFFYYELPPRRDNDLI